MENCLPHLPEVFNVLLAQKRAKLKDLVEQTDGVSGINAEHLKCK